jgi:hypothetical protein
MYIYVLTHNTDKDTDKDTDTDADTDTDTDNAYPLRIYICII